MCPWCGHDHGIPLHAAAPPARLGDLFKANLYLGSSFFPPFGFIIGSAYLKMPDPEFQHVGRNCMTLGYISLAVYIGISVVAFVVHDVL